MKQSILLIDHPVGKRDDRASQMLQEMGYAIEWHSPGKGDDLPFGCAICREPFVDPVVTRCKHYFCEHCALKRYANNKTCAVCGKDTGGQFNVAHDILRRRKQLEREAKRARTS